MMHQKIKYGIVLDKEVTIDTDLDQQVPIVIRVFQLMAIILGTISFVSILTQAFQMTISKEFVYTVIFLLGGMFYSLFIWKSYDKMKIGIIIALYFIFIINQLRHLINGFYLFENQVIKAINTYYSSGLELYKANYMTKELDLTLFILVIAIAVEFLLTLAVIRNRFMNFIYILLLIPIVSSFIVGFTPKESNLIIYVFIMIFLLKSNVSHINHINKGQVALIQKINSRVAVLLSVLGIIIIFLMKAFITPEEYMGIKEIPQTKTELQTFLFNFSMDDLTDMLKNSKFNIFGSKDSYKGGLSGGKLGRVDEVKFNNTDELKLFIPPLLLNSNFYIKGYVGSEYSGDQWGELPPNAKQRYNTLLQQLNSEGFSPINQSDILLKKLTDYIMDDSSNIPVYIKMRNTTLSYYSGKYTIQYIGANKNYLYVPYHADYDSLDNKDMVQDMYVLPSNKTDQYELQFNYEVDIGNDIQNLQGLNDKLDDYLKSEKKYRNYVYDVYTRVPDMRLMKVKKELAQPKEYLKTVTGKIDYVREYLYNNTAYTLSPGKLPVGKDFVEYFLYDNKLGYCAHYASAATAMLRILGVPARYVEGYVVDQTKITSRINVHQDQFTVFNDYELQEYNTTYSEIIVKDNGAHAWVEVYIDGCGWYPVEFTPGNSIVETSRGLNNIMRIQEMIAPIDHSQNTPANDTNTPTLTPNDQLNKDNMTPDQPIEKETKNKTALDPRLIKLMNAIKVLLVLFIFSLVGILSVKYYVLMMKKKRRRRTKNLSKKALLLYDEIEQMLAFSKAIQKGETDIDKVITNAEQRCFYMKLEEFISCKDIFLEARFRKDIINRDQYSKVRELRNTLYQSIYNKSSILKKLYLRFLLSI